MIQREKKLLLVLFTIMATLLFSSTEKDNPFRKVARDVTPSIVQINTTYTTKVRTGDSPFDFFFNNRNSQDKPKYREYQSQGLGSGIVVEEKGEKKYILTNNHVIKGATELEVHFINGKVYKAELVGTDVRKDIALLVIKTKDSVVKAELGDSDDVFIGDWAIAIGSPLGYESSVTLGIISAIGRKPNGMVADFTDYIQTDAAINKGNSGGALVNIDGEVIGINTWIASENGGNIGLGFSIPINNTKDVIAQLIDKGKIEYGWLGVSMGAIPKSIIEVSKIKDIKGAFIYNLFKGSPAEKAGIKPGDIVTEINGKLIKSKDALLHTVGVLPANKKATFKIIREGKNLTLDVYPKLRTEKVSQGLLWPGINTVPITDDIVNAINDKSVNKIEKSIKGVIIYSVMPNSIAKYSGLVSSDIITDIDGKKITSIKDFYRAIAGARNQVTFNIIRMGQKIKLILVNE